MRRQSQFALGILILCFTLNAQAERRRGPSAAESTHETEYPAFEFNLAGAAGSINGKSYFEVQLGVNTVFLPWLVWRNAPFYRFGSGADGVFGIDSSLLGRLRLSPNVGVDAGGGYRLATNQLSAPFLETRIGLSFERLFFQLGVKYLINSVMRSGASNDLVYSVGASASARL